MALKLYFTPGRSWLPRWLLDEQDEPFELVELDIQKGESHKPDYLAINPLGKLPALDVDGHIMTETAAICLYLADRKPGFAIPPDDPERGRYLTLIVHASAALEPAFEDVLIKRESDPLWVGWRPVKDELAFVEHHLGEGPWLFGERFTAADIMIGGVLVWATQLELETTPKLKAYVGRLMARPALAKLFQGFAEMTGQQPKS
jgi:glutathione S-transferase